MSYTQGRRKAAAENDAAQWSDSQVMMVTGGLAGCGVLMGATAWLSGRTRRKAGRRTGKTAAARASKRGRTAAPTIVVPEAERPHNTPLDQQPVRRRK